MSLTVSPQSAETPFRINISQERLNLLKEKLSLVRLPDELEDAGSDYGTPLSDVQRLLARWKDGYDWRIYEKQLNDELPQFQQHIDVNQFGKLKIHYVHKKSEIEGAIPLLFIHGWPGSFIEVRKIMPLLVQGSCNHPSFHVVAFSLPNFGFSEAPKKRGFGISQYAEVGHKLMLALGYEEYVTQGGDWGYAISRRIAKQYGGKHCKAWHTNWEGLRSSSPTFFRSPLLYLSNFFHKYSASEQAGLERAKWYWEKSSGYFAEQSTQPQTIGYSLADSPAGLLGWFYGKLVEWTDNYQWEDDEVLTWISIYYFSAAGPAASVRIYYERVNESLVDDSPTLPHGASFFPKEITNFPRSWTRNKYRIFEAEHDSGGHFAAYEQPDELVADLRKMFGKNGPAYRVVTDKPGY